MNKKNNRWPKDEPEFAEKKKRKEIDGKKKKTNEARDGQKNNEQKIFKTNKRPRKDKKRKNKQNSDRQQRQKNTNEIQQQGHFRSDNNRWVQPDFGNRLTIGLFSQETRQQCLCRRPVHLFFVCLPESPPCCRAILYIVTRFRLCYVVSNGRFGASIQSNTAEFRLPGDEGRSLQYRRVNQTFTMFVIVLACCCCTASRKQR